MWTHRIIYVVLKSKARIVSENFSFFKNFPQSSRGSERRDSKKERERQRLRTDGNPHKNLEMIKYSESRMSRNPVNDGYTNPEKEAEIHRSNQQREREMPAAPGSQTTDQEKHALFCRSRRNLQVPPNNTRWHREVPALQPPSPGQYQESPAGGVSKEPENKAKENSIK